jgi:hypothetical protein
MSLPGQFPFHVERQELPGSEPGIDVLPVRHRAGTREVVLAVNGRELAAGAFGTHTVLPHAIPIGAIESFHEKDHVLGG